MYRFQSRQESQDKETQESSTRLWQFSLELWRHDAVQTGLLTLQDESGANINALLFAAWLALEGRNFDPNCVAQSGLSDWNATMTAPLRALRRQARSVNTELYQSLKSAELAAERHEQVLLVATLDQHAPTDALSREALMQANLVSYLHTLGACDVSVALHHCAALLQQTRLYTESATLEPDSP